MRIAFLIIAILGQLLVPTITVLPSRAATEEFEVGSFVLDMGEHEVRRIGAESGSDLVRLPMESGFVPSIGKSAAEQEFIGCLCRLEGFKRVADPSSAVDSGTTSFFDRPAEIKFLFTPSYDCFAFERLTAIRLTFPQCDYDYIASRMTSEYGKPAMNLGEYRRWERAGQRLEIRRHDPLAPQGKSTATYKHLGRYETLGEEFHTGMVSVRETHRFGCFSFVRKLGGKSEQ